MTLLLALLAAPPTAFLGQALDDYPRLRSDVQAHYVSSYDRSGGNDDGFDGTYSALYVDERGEHVIFDVKGSGTLYNLWFTSRVNGRSPLGWGRIKFYFDDEETPRVDMEADELFSGQHPPFVPPFVYHAFESTGGYVSYLPFPFHERLKITTERRVGFYNAYYHTYSSDRPVESWTGQEDISALERMWTRAGAPPTHRSSVETFSGRVSLEAPAMPDGEPVPSRETLFDYPGAGTITSLRFNPLFPLTAYQLQHIVLRIFWDGAATPAVESPLGSFFGSGLGEASVRAVPLGMSPSGPYYCYLPMPFWRGARIELVNENPDEIPEIWWEVAIAGNDAVESETGTFHAHYRREWPTTQGVDYGLLDVEGRGTYVGQVMTVEPLRAEIKRWWEGDLRIYVDGQTYPAFSGTGHEDEYLGGWSNEWLMNPYSLPMHGEPKTTELRQVDFQWSAATTVYRFFVGGIPFQNGIKVSTEHGAENTADAMYSSVAYYYARPDGMERLDEASASASFKLTVPAGYSGLRLRRSYHPALRQEAEVWMNGERVGVWYSADVNAYVSELERDFLLPSVGAGSEIEIEIRPLGPDWSAFRYELWGLQDDGS
jgi:hypothetical protein